MPRAAASRALRMCTSWPSKRIRPRSIWWTPAMQRVSTDLPAPLSPHRPVTWPAGMSRLTPCNACTGPKCLSIPRSCSSASDTGTAPARAAARQHVDEYRDYQDKSGDDVFVLRGQPQKRHSICDGSDDKTAEDAVDRLTSAAEKARASDDRRGDCVEDQLARICCIGTQLPIEERAEKDPGDPRRDRAEYEAPGADHREAHVGPPRRFRVTADRINVATESSPLEKDGRGNEDHEHDRDNPGDPCDNAKIRPVDVTDGNDRGPRHREKDDLDCRHARRLGYEPAATSLGVATPDHAAGNENHNRKRDPADRRIDQTLIEVEHDALIRVCLTNRNITVGSPQEKDEDAEEKQEAAQRHDEGRHPEPGN